MTNEEKLKRLLQVAVENGWKSPLKTPFEACKITPMKRTQLAYQINPDIEYDEVWVFIHLNDLMTNWEEGEISFIDALVKMHKVLKPYDHIGNPYINWSWNMKEGKPRPTSQRLDWLFETFKHLL
jgi:hypothetical protein